MSRPMRIVAPIFPPAGVNKGADTGTVTVTVTVKLLLIYC